MLTKLVEHELANERHICRIVVGSVYKFKDVLTNSSDILISKTFVKQKTNLEKQNLHGQYYPPAYKYYYEALLCSEDLEIYLRLVANGM